MQNSSLECNICMSIFNWKVELIAQTYPIPHEPEPSEYSLCLAGELQSGRSLPDKGTLISLPDVAWPEVGL